MKAVDTNRRRLGIALCIALALCFSIPHKAFAITWTELHTDIRANVFSSQDIGSPWVSMQTWRYYDEWVQTASTTSTHSGTIKGTESVSGSYVNDHKGVETGTYTITLSSQPSYKIVYKSGGLYYGLSTAADSATSYYTNGTVYPDVYTNGTHHPLTFDVTASGNGGGNIKGTRTSIVSGTDTYTETISTNDITTESETGTVSGTLEQNGRIENDLICAQSSSWNIVNGNGYFCIGTYTSGSLPLIVKGDHIMITPTQGIFRSGTVGNGPNKQYSLTRTRILGMISFSNYVELSTDSTGHYVAQNNLMGVFVEFSTSGLIGSNTYFYDRPHFYIGSDAVEQADKHNVDATEEQTEELKDTTGSDTILDSVSDGGIDGFESKLGFLGQIAEINDSVSDVFSADSDSVVSFPGYSVQAAGVSFSVPASEIDVWSSMPELQDPCKFICTFGLVCVWLKGMERMFLVRILGDPDTSEE